jgi:hypothetical protein
MNAKCGGNRDGVGEDRPQGGKLLRHPGEAQAARSPLEPHGRWSDTEAQHCLIGAGTQPSRSGKRKCRSDCRVPSHGQLPGPRENADTRVSSGSLGGKYESAFGESHFVRDPLHLPFINSCGIEEHGQLVACEGLIRKNIEMDVLKNRHRFPTPLRK